MSFTFSVFLRPSGCVRSGLRTYHVGLHSPSSRLFGARTRFHSLAESLATNSGPVTRSSAERRPFLSLYKAAGIAGVGLGISAFMAPVVQCEGSGSVPSPPQPAAASPSSPPPPTSTVNLYELSFGTVCGICAGVFLKKGAKALAFLLGGVFVLLQYLGSTSIVRVDWGRMATRFENLFYTTDALGTKRAPTVYSLWSWFVNFLTADFQPRASFIAGMALGLRVG